MQWAWILKAPSEKKIEICKQEVKMQQYLIFLDEDLVSLHSCLHFSIFFSSYILGCFQNPSSLLFIQVCIVSYWSCTFVKLCQNNVLFVPDLLRLFYIN
jgi:hypothetical protein